MVHFWGHMGAQLLKPLASAQVMISRFMGSSPAWGSVLTARSLEPASDSVFPSLSAPPQLALSLEKIKIKMSIKKNNKTKKKNRLSLVKGRPQWVLIV